MHHFYLLAQNEMSQDLDFGMMIFRMLIFLGIILVLIYVVLRKGLPLLVNPSMFRSSSVKILERVPVDQKRSLLVVEVQDKIYLMGSAEGQINVLMELDPEKMKAPAAQGKTSFESVLKKVFWNQKETKTERT